MTAPIPLPTPSRITRARARGFSLVELLVVITVMSVLLSLSMPAINGILAGNLMERGTRQVSAMLDQARAQAIAQNTYVGVGLINDDAGGMRVAAVRAADGSPDLSGANLRPVARAAMVEGVRLVGLSELDNALQTKVNSRVGSDETVDMSSPGSGQSFTYAKVRYDAVIIFTPQGEALVPSGGTASSNTPFVPYILIALREARGSTLTDNKANSACISLNGGNSQQKILRL